MERELNTESEFWAAYDHLTSLIQSGAAKVQLDARKELNKLILQRGGSGKQRRKLSATRISEVTGMDSRTVKKKLELLSPEWDEYELLSALKGPTKSETSRADKLKTEAALKRLSLEERKGNLIRRSQAHKEFTAAIQGLYAQLFSVMPKRLAGQLVGKNEKEIRSLLSQEIRQVFENARNNHTTYLGVVCSGDPHDGSATEPVG